MTQAGTKPFCPGCGEPTITACPECNASIKGDFLGMPSFVERPMPPFCEGCGAAYPWQISRVANAVDLLRLEGVEDSAVQEIEQSLADITKDTPRTQVAAVRILKVLGKLKRPIYDVAIKIIADIASSQAKSRLGL
jgi:hypothetical protein